MSQSPVTRMELLKLRTQKKLAVKGHSLLKKKRDTLIKEFFKLIKEYKNLKETTLKALHMAFETLHIAQGVSGVNRVKSLAVATAPSFSVNVKTKNLMGVKIPQLHFLSKETGRSGSTIGTSYHVERARREFVRLLPLLVKLAEIEQIIYTVAEEIKKTKRRVNSLEHIRIPELALQERKMKEQLGEMEREEFSRLKNVKKKLQAQ